MLFTRYDIGGPGFDGCAKKQFYCLMGEFFGSHAVEREMGVKVYADPGLHYILATEDGAVIGFTSWSLRGRAATGRYNYTIPERRRQGVYRQLCAARDAALAGVADSITAVVREGGASYQAWIAQGAAVAGRKSAKYVMVRRDLR